MQTLTIAAGFLADDTSTGTRKPDLARGEGQTRLRLLSDQQRRRSTLGMVTIWAEEAVVNTIEVSLGRVPRSRQQGFGGGVERQPVRGQKCLVASAMAACSLKAGFRTGEFSVRMATRTVGVMAAAGWIKLRRGVQQRHVGRKHEECEECGERKCQNPAHGPEISPHRYGPKIPNVSSGPALLTMPRRAKSCKTI